MQIAKEVGLNRIFKYGLFTLWQLVFDLLPFSPLRVWWLKIGGTRVGRDTVIDKIDFINLDRSGLTGLNVGSRCFLGRGVLLDLAGEVKLENWVTLSPRAVILSHLNVGFVGHPLLKSYPSRQDTTRIKRGSFVGVGAIVLGGTTIGPQSLIGAGSVVTKNIASQSVAVGSPAKVVKRISP